MELEEAKLPAVKAPSQNKEVQSKFIENEEQPKIYLSGWRLHVLTAGMWIALFLSTVETTIVSTSLVSITNALSGFDKRDWIVTSYLLTYTVFRAFQGFGASGIYSMTLVIAPTIIPPGQMPKYIALISTVFALASVVGPLMGGAITESGQWKWKRQDHFSEPIFPPQILKSRITASMFAASFFLGFPFTSVVINIPQRAQAVYAFSSQHAGITLLPLLLTSPLATVASGLLTSNGKVPPVYLVMAGAVTQIIGMGLTCSLPTDILKFPSQQYGFEAIMGIGFGLTLSTILTLAPLVADERDLPVTMGALTQIRVLSGTFGLAISATVLNDHVTSRLSTTLDPQELEAISNSLGAIKSLSPTQQSEVRVAFAEGFNQQNIVLAVFSAAALFSSLGLWERRPLMIVIPELWKTRYTDLSRQ
uniref:Putative transporter C3H1.06c n=1 Tax=Talaromyces marneffei PM1 TaxID=1077442 RepID=A0A093UWI9_TALMA